MRTNKFPSLLSPKGLTLVELLVVTVIIGLIAIVATPAISAFRDKSRVASGLGTANTIQAALTSYTTTSASHLYPETITSYDDLLSIVEDNGASLQSSEEKMGLQFQSYSAIDTDGDGEYESYTMTLRVLGVASKRPGWCIVVEPSGVGKCAAL